ncbi:MAG: hypothetical protein OEO23_07530 [Gemmatimonadota bacterium]|nr:hypothetical protein [Gemmatimonadota bacterium]
MSHIDDAHIEAYVDGAYDVLGPDLVDEIEERLRGDAALAERVRTARATRAAASDILALASPGPGDMPSFQELQERAAAVGGPSEVDPRRRWIGLPPIVGLGWAATVVLALGVGWFVGQNSSVEAPFARADLNEVAGPEQESFEPQARLREAPATADAAPEQDLVVEGQEAPGMVGEMESSDVVVTGQAGERAAELERFEEGVEVLDLADETARDAATAAANLTVSPSEATARSPEAARQEAARVQVDRDAGAGLEVQRKAVDALMPSPTAFADHELHSLALPGLEVIGVGLNEEGALSGLEVLHRLPTGDTLSLRYVGLFSQPEEPLGREEARAASETLPSIIAQIQGAALPLGWNQVVVRKEDRWVVARAPISEEEIRAYLMTLN